MLSSLSEVQAIEQRPFTVSDSIGMTRIVTSDSRDSSYAAIPVFKFSPDGKSVVYVTVKGNLQTGLNEYVLVLLSTDDVLAFVNGVSAGLPKQRVLARFETAAPGKEGVDRVQWSADSTIVAFIGRKRDEIGQVYCVDIRSLAMTQLTNHPNDIATFGLRLPDRLVYSAYTPPDWDVRNRRGYVVSSEFSYLLSSADPHDLARSNIRYFSFDLIRKTTIAIDLDPGYLRAGEVSIAPAGNFAVIANTVRKFPKAWARYDFLRANPTLVAASSVSGGEETDAEFVEFDEAFGRPDPWIEQYFIADMTTGYARPLLDAPTVRVGEDLRLNAKWSTDGQHVLMPASYWPPSGFAAGRENSSEAQSILEVDIDTSRVRKVYTLGASGKHFSSAWPLTDMKWSSANEVALTFLRDTQISSAAVVRFKRDGSGWREFSSRTTMHDYPGGASSSSQLMLRVYQDLNVPPDVLALDLVTHRQRVITRQNPQLEELTLGIAKTFEWSDSHGRRFTGGLVYPPYYDPQRRYPVVLQTNGFVLHRFLVDGGHGGTSPHAARAIANKGILVLQMPNLHHLQNLKATGFEDAGETPLFLAGVESAIDALDQAGLIDRARVGIIGFSREGMRVHYAITFSKYGFAAATIADSIALTPACYAGMYGEPYPGMAEFELERIPPVNLYSAIGAPFWGSGIHQWMDRSYIYHLDRIHTPIRYEEYGTLTEPCNWEPFAILKRHHRPVEMIHIPFAEHSLKPPYARYTSQQGNVDWFDFWLNDDRDRPNTDEYLRWRQLREQALLGAGG